MVAITAAVSTVVYGIRHHLMVRYHSTLCEYQVLVYLVFGINLLFTHCSNHWLFRPLLNISTIG